MRRLLPLAVRVKFLSQRADAGGLRLDTPDQQDYRGTTMRVCPVSYVQLRVTLVAVALTAGSFHRAVADTLETWDDLDALVTNVYATMGFASGMSTLPPPAPMRVWQGLAPVPFDPAGLPGLTNGVAAVPLAGIDTWGVNVVETQLSTRVWIYFGADGMVLRTNSAAELCDPDAWLTTRYGQPPAWLGGAELADWIASRERARVSLHLRLVPADDFSILCDLLAACATNAVPPQANDPVAPADTNRLAFAGLLPRADETHLRFWLYAPQDHLPVDLFGSATRAPPSDWFHVGQLDATTPFTSWEMPDLGLSGFFLAARADIDTDGDRLPDAREWLLYGTDSTVADSDGDGLDDGNEVEQTDTDPGSPDSDCDGLDDGDEVEQTDTDPGNPDSDGDGMWDFAEIATGTSPSDPADALETNSAVMVEIVWPEAQGGPDFWDRGIGIDAIRWSAGSVESGWALLVGDDENSPAGRGCLCLLPGQTVMLGVLVRGNLGYTGAPADATVTLAGYGPSAAICIQDGEPIGIVAPSNVEICTLYCILQADLDIDSDNSAGLGLPEGTAAEDRIEDDPTLPGKVIAANDGDSDDDGVPDFADGYNRDGSAGNADDASTNDCFVPLVLRIPALPGSMGPAALRLVYSASDPAAVTVSGTPPLFSPAPGHLRIWTRNADQPRNPAACTAATPGDYVPPGTYADLTALGFVDGPGTVTLYVEGIAPSALAGDQRITVELDPDGPGEVYGWVVTDAVRVSVARVQIGEWWWSAPTCVKEGSEAIVRAYPEHVATEGWTATLTPIPTAPVSASILCQRGTSVCSVVWEGTMPSVEFNTNGLLSHIVVLVEGTNEVPTATASQREIGSNMVDIIKVRGMRTADIVHVSASGSTASAHGLVIKDYSMLDSERTGALDDLMLDASLADLDPMFATNVLNTLRYVLDTKLDCEQARERDSIQASCTDPPLATLDIPSTRGVGFFPIDTMHFHVRYATETQMNAATNARNAFLAAVHQQQQFYGITDESGFTEKEDRDRFCAFYDGTAATLVTFLNAVAAAAGAVTIWHTYEYAAYADYVDPDGREALRFGDPIRNIKTNYSADTGVYGLVNDPDLHYPGSPDSSVPTDANPAMTALYQNELIQLSVFSTRDGHVRIFYTAGQNSGKALQLADAYGE